MKAVQEFALFLRDKVNLLSKESKKNLIATVVLLFLVAVLPLGINLVQRMQTYYSQASGEMIELIADGECVYDAANHQIKCAKVPLKLTSPYGPRVIPSPSASPSPSVAPSVTSCNPRPDIVRSSQMTADGMVVTMSAGVNTSTPVNSLQTQIEFTAFDNATLTIDGNVYTEPFVFQIPQGGRDSIQMLIKQVTYNQESKITLKANDICGEYPLFFGGGTGAGWPTPAPSPVACNPRPDIVRTSQMTADGMVVTMSASVNTSTPVNSLQTQIDFTAFDNATLTIDGNVYTQPFVFQIPQGGRDSIQMLIKQVTYNQESKITLKANDACGEYPLFFGGGTGAGWPTPAPSPVACNPRPNVGRSTSMGVNGMTVVLTAGTNSNTPTNPISQIKFNILDNARVLIDNQNNTQPFTISYPAPVTTAEFLIKQVTTGQPTTVRLQVVDTCGDYSLFFGGGNEAGWPATTSWLPGTGGLMWIQSLGVKNAYAQDDLSNQNNSQDNSDNTAGSNDSASADAVAAAHFPLTGLIGYWNMDDTPGTFIEDTTDKHDGVASGDTITVSSSPGVLGNAKSFNSETKDKIEIADDAVLSPSQLSVSAWVNPKSAARNYYASIFNRRSEANQGGMTFELEGDADKPTGSLHCDVSTPDAAAGYKRVISTANIVLNAWNHVVCTYDGAAVRIYINGAAAGSTNTTGAMTNPEGVVTRIGSNIVTGESWDGDIDEVGYWGRALTQAEITGLYNGGAGVSYPQCADGIDNDGDEAADSVDSACHSDWNPANNATYDATIAYEGTGTYTQCSDSRDNDGDGTVDGADAQCHTDGNPANSESVDPFLPSEYNSTEGTLSFKLAESEAGLATAEETEYADHPVIVDYTLSDSAPGAKQIWVQFKSAGGEWSNPDTIFLELIEPPAQLTGVSCTLDIGKSNLKVTVKGSSLGSSPGTVTANDEELDILEWSPTQVSGLLSKPTVSIDEGAEFLVNLKKADGTEVDGEVCQVNTTLISLGAQVFCRDYGDLAASDVAVTIVDETGAKAEETVSIDQKGVIKGLTTRLQTGKRYAFSIKAPHTIRRTAVLTLQEGTTVLTAKDGKPFILPIGDISPRNLLDGKINTADRSELIRQWRLLGTNTGTLTGDFNRDTKVNSIDWACMRYDFNAEDEPIPSSAPLETPTPSPTPTPSAAASVTVNPSPSPSPAPSTSPLSAKMVMFSDKNTLAVGEQFNLNIAVRSDADALNLVAAILYFSPEKLEVVSIDKSGSFATYWTEEYFDNSTGEISAVGGLPTPGYKTVGTDGLFVKVVMKTKSSGTGLINFVNGSQIFRNSDSGEMLDFSAQGLTLTIQ